MSPTLNALLGYLLWTMFLIGIIITYRGLLVLARLRPIDDFPADKPHEGPAWYHRVIRAHLNTLENLPLFIGVCLAATVSGKTVLTDPYAPYVLYARMAQSTIHLVQFHPQLIWLRFAGLAVQLGLIGWMIALLLGWVV